MDSEVDLTSVRTLVTSVSKLAKHLKVSNSAIYRWTEVNRIPGAHIIGVANFYDVEIADLLPLTGSDKAHRAKPKVKGQDVLPALLEVYRGVKTLDAACEEVGIPIVSGKLIMMHWGDELPTLHTTLLQLHEKRIDIEKAMDRLNVGKASLHDLRRKYGFAPRSQKDYVPRPKAEKKRESQWSAAKAMALQVIAGKSTAIELSKVPGAPSYRSIFRHVEKLTPLKLNDLAHWPDIFREAYALEIEKETPKYAEKWVKYAEKQRLVLRTTPKYPKTPDSWASVPLKRMLIGVLLGQATLVEVAAAKGGDPTVIAGLFTGDLRPLDMTFEEAVSLSITHQVALCEILLAILDRRRKFVEVVKNDQ